MRNDYTNAVLVLNHNGVGQADPALSHKLATNYFRTLIELGQHPAAIVFYAEGVKLVATGSACQKELEELSFGYASIIGQVISRGITPIIIH